MPRLFEGRESRSAAYALGAAVVAHLATRLVPPSTQVFSLMQTREKHLHCCSACGRIVTHHRRHGDLLTHTQEEAVLLVAFGLLWFGTLPHPLTTIHPDAHKSRPAPCYCSGADRMARPAPAQHRRVRCGRKQRRERVAGGTHGCARGLRGAAIPVLERLRVLRGGRVDVLVRLAGFAQDFKLRVEILFASLGRCM
ncbi:hypothetical protein C2E23DRAFT_103743 [Lenzites betulinus]|nr:hypothetical protein C2E23DRAFT_103743 [Lenzites betulinus]